MQCGQEIYKGHEEYRREINVFFLLRPSFYKADTFNWHSPLKNIMLRLQSSISSTCTLQTGHRHFKPQTHLLWYYERKLEVLISGDNHEQGRPYNTRLVFFSVIELLRCMSRK